MDRTTFQEMLSTEGQRCLKAAVELQPDDRSFLRCHGRLIRHWPDTLVKACLETAMLRQKALAKFPRADQMYFTREALEQSSPDAVAQSRAGRFRDYPSIVDGCCGIGGDALALAAGHELTAIDLDPLRLDMARENLRLAGHTARFHEGDVLDYLEPTGAAIFLDPDRRSDGRRHLKIEEYSPRLSHVRAMLPQDYPLAVKIAPAVDWGELHSLDAEVEFVSLQGELKEACLWFGSLRTSRRRATVLPTGISLACDEPAPPGEIDAPQAYLYDPDPAITRAGLVTNLGQMLGARQIDPMIAFLTSEVRQETPFAQCYPIREVIPFQAKRLRERLRSLQVGKLTLIKRGSAIDVNELRRQLAPQGSESATVILTTISERPVAILST